MTQSPTMQVTWALSPSTCGRLPGRSISWRSNSLRAAMALVAKRALGAFWSFAMSDHVFDRPGAFGRTNFCQPGSPEPSVRRKAPQNGCVCLGTPPKTKHDTSGFPFVCPLQSTGPLPRVSGHLSGSKVRVSLFVEGVGFMRARMVLTWKPSAHWRKQLVKSR